MRHWFRRQLIWSMRFVLTMERMHAKEGGINAETLKRCIAEAEVATSQFDDTKYL